MKQCIYEYRIPPHFLGKDTLQFATHSSLAQSQLRGGGGGGGGETKMRTTTTTTTITTTALSRPRLLFYPRPSFASSSSKASSISKASSSSKSSTTESEPYLRLHETDTGDWELQSSQVTYVNEQKTCEIDLIATVHVGEKEYYKNLERDLVSQNEENPVLFELLTDERNVERG